MNRNITKVDFKVLTKEEWEELLKTKKLEEEFDKIIPGSVNNSETTTECFDMPANEKE